MLELLTCEDFTPLIGLRLRLSLDQDSIDAEVIEARELQQPSPRPAAAFSLILRAPPDWLKPQGLFQLQHPRHGIMELFLVPIARDAVGVLYEAVFN